MISTNFHATNFMIDLEDVNGLQDNMQGYIKRELDYDLAFCRAWSEIESAKKEEPSNSADLLSLLDKIQKCSLSHLPQTKQVGSGFQIIQGRATINFFGLTKGPNSNEEGIKDIIEKIWINSENFELITKDKDPDKRYILIKDELFVVSSGGTKKTTLIKNDGSSSKETVKKIFEMLIPLYNLGICPNGSDRMMILHQTEPKVREKKALQIFDSYLKTIKTKDSDIEKIKTIALTIRDLMQLHLYYDGNARSLYMLANLFLFQSDMSLFYPRNMCMFEGNSLDKMVKEVVAGQERFASMFGKPSDLANGLKNYQNAVIELKTLVSNYFSKSEAMKKSVEERSLNLLLRQSASDPKNIILLEFLLNNKLALNIDILSKGEKSGNALDVANKFNNLQAVELLNNHGLK